MKFCIYTRAFYEIPYLDFFIEHYVKIGFDKIIILKCDRFNYKIPIKYIPYVEIHNVPNLENRLLLQYDHLIKKSTFTWVLSIDNDEILLLNKKYKTISDYVTEKLTINKDINTFYFRWGVIEKFDNNSNPDCGVNFINILKTYKVFSNSHIKSMVKINMIHSISHQHIIKLKTTPVIYLENMQSVLHMNKPNKHPITKNSYQEHILIHLHTRSINNLILKSLVTILGKNVKRISKKIRNKIDFIAMINCFDINNMPAHYILLEQFKACIGLKAELPFAHSNNETVDINCFINPKQLDYEQDCIDQNKEKFIIEKELLNNKVNLEKYYYFTNILNNYITNTKLFLKYT